MGVLHQHEGVGVRLRRAVEPYGGAVIATYYTYPYYAKNLYVFDPNVGGDVQEIAPATFGGQGTYGVVGHVEVSDDGSTMGCTFCSSAYYN